MAKTDSGNTILLRGAFENNLNNVTVSVPVGLLTCLTGVSGSGKSTLVDDCLVAEATRRHHVLSRSTRRISTPYSPRLDEARVPFVVCVRQGILQWNSRSTVATATGLLQRLRDVIICHPEVRADGKLLGSLSAETIAEWCVAHHGKSSAGVLAVVERRVLGPVRPYIAKAAQLVRDVPITFSVVETGELPSVTGEPASKLQRLVTKTQRDVYVIVGEPVSVKRADDLVARIRLAMSVAKSPDDIGLAFPGGDVVLFTGCLLHPSDSRLFWVPSHSLLSFNSQLPRSGRCSRCDGTGVVEEIGETGLIADPKLSLAGGGLCIPFESNNARYKYFSPLAEEIRGLLAAHSLSINSAWKDLKDGVRAELLLGSGERIIQPLNPTGGPRGKRKPFVGLIERIRSKLAGGDSSANAVLAKLRQSGPCPDCDGTRLNHAARSIYFGGLSLPGILNQSLAEASDWLEKTARALSYKPSSETLSALSALCRAGKRLGLGHLALSRPVGTLSGGEAQRLRIAGSLSAHLHGACYALDEPTRGLHAADATQLSDTLRNLADGKTTVLLVEHNPAVVAAADRVIEIGPGGGVNGGKVIYDGPPKGSPLLNTPETKRKRPDFSPVGELSMKGVTFRNIQNQDVAFPLGGVVCVTGVSGSGKSTLVRDVLVPALETWIESRATTGDKFQKLTVRGKIDRLVYVGQNALSTNPRSLVLSFLGLADGFRDWFHRNSDASDLGLSAGHFSSNTALGQCPACEGLGRVGQSGDGSTICSACAGTRFHPHVLFAKCYNLGVGDWLARDLQTLSVSEGTPDFLHRAAQLADDLGVGHLSLGRSLPTLSGGECQRLRIVKALLEVQEPTKGKALHQLFVMDEPAAGLHPADVDKLNIALHRVVAKGENTLVIVEHNLSVIRLADWVIDVGPLSADQGGQIMFTGPVQELLRTGSPETPTRLALQDKLPTAKPKRVYSRPQAHDDQVQSSSQAIGAFRDYLANSLGESDPDKGETPATPAYLISTGGNDTHASHDVLGLLALSLPLFRLFAAESSVSGQAVYPDDDGAYAAAIDALKERSERRAAWFPATTIATEGAVTWEDVRSAVKKGIAAGTREWFDGKSIVHKSPPATLPFENIQHVRMMIPQGMPKEEAVHRAFALGEGWLSVIDTRTSQVFDFSTRVLNRQHLRIGARWSVPQIFDSGIAQTACLLCKGGGTIEGVNEKLVIADRKSGIRHDRLLTKHALEVLRASRRRQMFPVIDRLAESGLMKLDIALSEMPSDLLESFWFGYPDKSFLSVGGDRNRKGDWYQWLGLANYVIEHMWKSSDRDWANELNASRRQRNCPRCAGTGLGWEARMREVNGVTLQSILSQWTVKQVSDWLDQVIAKTKDGASALEDARIKAKFAIRFGLELLKCGDKYPSLSSQQRVQISIVSNTWNQLIGATTYIRPPASGLDRVKSLVKAARRTGDMRWLLEKDNA